MRKLNSLILLFVFFSFAAIAQTEKKPVALVFNNGIGNLGFAFNYLETSESGAEIIEFQTWSSSPYVANPGIRFFTKRGFNEIGFYNIKLGSSGFLKSGTNTNQQNDNEYSSFFSSSIYFNKSYRLGDFVGGELFLGFEPTFNYQTISRGIDLSTFLFMGHCLTGEFNILLRWEQYFKDNIFISIVGGLSPIYLEYLSVEHRLTDIYHPAFVNQSNFSFRNSQVARISFGLKI